MINFKVPGVLETMPNHRLSEIAREESKDERMTVYFCPMTGFFGIGLDIGDRNGVPLFKELVSLGQDLNQVSREKIVELKQRLHFDVREAQAFLKGWERETYEQTQAEANEEQAVRSFLARDARYTGPHPRWRPDKLRFSFENRPLKTQPRHRSKTLV